MSHDNKITTFLLYDKRIVSNWFSEIGLGGLNFYRHGELVRQENIKLKLSELLKSNTADSENIFEDVFGDDWNIDRTENLFSDAYVNGKEILFDSSLDITLESSKYVNGVKVESSHDDELIVEYIIEITEISKDFHLYIVSGNKAANAEDAGFSEPIQVHSNIQNGLGILGAYNSYRFVSRFESEYYPYYRPWWNMRIIYFYINNFIYLWCNSQYNQ